MDAVQLAALLARVVVVASRLSVELGISVALLELGLAGVYAVLVESGLNATRVGKLIMSACFVTDVLTALALSAIFITPNAWFPLFLVASAAAIAALPKLAVLLGLVVIADVAKGHAVLPAFVLGLVMARHCQRAIVRVAVDGSGGAGSICAAVGAELTALVGGHFLGDHLLGSTADGVAHHAHCPVVVVR